MMGCDKAVSVNHIKPFLSQVGFRYSNRKKTREEIGTRNVVYCWAGPDHVAFMPWTVLWDESRGFGSFELGKPLSAQSSVSCCGSLKDNAESSADDRGLAVKFLREV